VLFLSQFVGGIVAVLADDEHRIHRQFVAPAAQGLGDRRIDLEAKLPSALPSQVVFRSLIDVGRDHVERRSVPLPVTRVTREETLAHVPGVRVKAPLRSYDCQFLALALQLLPGGKAGGRGGSAYRAKEGSSGNHGFSSGGSPVQCALESGALAPS